MATPNERHGGPVAAVAWLTRAAVTSAYMALSPTASTKATPKDAKQHDTHCKNPESPTSPPAA
ncbi:hypothetical protein [Streptomyces spinoverrucosus]|nr:hypothetical protein [Streptomyces spinoverrucosus]GHB40643.1 hypothetical protein GCM10010397_08420 [Streptomyces spinoverrucosus]